MSSPVRFPHRPCHEFHATVLLQYEQHKILVSGLKSINRIPSEFFKRDNKVALKNPTQRKQKTGSHFSSQLKINILAAYSLFPVDETVMLGIILQSFTQCLPR